MTDDAVYSVALIPRLAHTHRLLERTVGVLRQDVMGSSDRYNATLCLDIMLQCSTRMQRVHRMEDIPETILPVIPALRAVSSMLACPMPQCSRMICEMAVHLGSIVLDAAILTGVCIDTTPCGRNLDYMLKDAQLAANSSGASCSGGGA